MIFSRIVAQPTSRWQFARADRAARKNRGPAQRSDGAASVSARKPNPQGWRAETSGTVSDSESSLMKQRPIKPPTCQKRRWPDTALQRFHAVNERHSFMNRPLDSRQLAAFAALARCQSFTLAAKELYLTQSAISHAIKALEREVGLPTGRSRGAPRAAHAGGRAISASRGKDSARNGSRARRFGHAITLGSRPAARGRKHHRVPVYSADGAEGV